MDRPDRIDVEPLAVSIATAARRLGVSRATAYRMVNDGTLRVVRWRTVTRVPIAAIDEILAGDRETAAAR